MRVDGVIRQVQRLGIRIRLTLEVLGPRSMFFGLLGANVREAIVWASSASTTTTPIVATAAAILAAATISWGDATTTATLTATAATSISVLHSL